MRQVKINKTEVKFVPEIVAHSIATVLGEMIFCPVQSHPKSDGLCQTDCAWFRITCKEIDKESEKEESESNNKYAYCSLTRPCPCMIILTRDSNRLAE